jgi:hypothetical protein
MTKEEIYNSAIEMYKKTGQGLPGFITLKIGRDEIDELIEEGKLKSIKQHYSYLPDDEWLCLTGVYCVEEEMAKGNHRPLDFIRIYLGVKGNSGIDAKMKEFFDENPEEKLKYDNEYKEWLNTNKEILEKSFQIQKVEIPSTPSKTTINKELSEYIKDSNWYIDNYSVKEAEKNISKKLLLNGEIKGLYKRKLQMMSPFTDPQAVEKTKKDLEKTEFELTMDSKVQKLLFKSNDNNKKVQEFFQNFNFS